MGEVMMRGNIVMKGYLKNPRATEQSFRGGWFQSGDLAVNHGNGRIELKDRSKGKLTCGLRHLQQLLHAQPDERSIHPSIPADIIISGGENISSIEVENIILMHPAIREIALVAKPDEKWGEVPCAFIVRQANDAAGQLTEKDVIAWARSKMAHFQVPKLDELPKTPSGLTSKAVLRRTAVSLVGR
jgi:fatty-acyl-CoA synthase